MAKDSLCVFEKLKEGTVPKELTEVISSKALLSEVISSDANSKTPLSNLEEHKAQNLLDILSSFGRSPLHTQVTARGFP